MAVRLTATVNGCSEVQAMLEGLARACEDQMRRGLVRVPLYQSGVRYAREPGQRERWQTAAETLRRKRGDCEDLVAWRVAELRAAGEPAAPLVYSPRPGLMHCVVRRGNGQREDPSKRLGMRGDG